MFPRIIAWALEQRLVVIAAVVGLVAWGLHAALVLPIDAVPDVTNVQVQINTDAPGLSPIEVERQVTFPIEVSMSGIPGIVRTRSVSKFGLSQVTVIFKDDVSIYFARQLVGERLQLARQEIAPGLGDPQMGPISTGLGEIFQYQLESPTRDLTELRTIQDWVVRPQLRTVPGVAEVNPFGGFEKQYEVLVRPESLVKYGLSLHDVVLAVAANNANAGGGYVVQDEQQYVVHGIGRVQGLEQIENVVVASHEGVPVRVRDLGDVVVGASLRQGAVTRDGSGECVIGIVMMLMGENSRTVVNDVKARVAQIQKTLPPDVKLRPFYDRTDLIERTIHTVEKNLAEGCLLVVVVLFLVLGNVRAAVLVALAIPLSMLWAISLMNAWGVPGSLMSLGAIDFGLVVDSSVIVVDNVVRRLAHRDSAARAVKDVVREGAVEVWRPTLFGILIIAVVYVPVLSLEGVEGKLFRPMALTVVFALLGSLVVALAVVPVLASLLLRSAAGKREPILVRLAHRAYEPVLDRALARPWHVLGGAAALAVLGFAIAPFLGSEFVPRLDEGSLLVEVRRPPGLSLDEVVENATAIERRLLDAFPDEVEAVVSKHGRPEIATDPASPNNTDFTILLHPRARWTKAKDREQLVLAMERELERFVGLSYQFSQPIEMRMNELNAGVRSDVAIKIFGEDLSVLWDRAARTVARVSRIPGASGFRVVQVAGMPTLRVRVIPSQLARYGVNASTVMETVEAVRGVRATEVLEGTRRFPLVVRFPEDARSSREDLAKVWVSAPSGARVALGTLSTIEAIEGPEEIARENAQRVVVVAGNVLGRDLGGFVADARRVFDEKEIDLPAGTWVEFGGQFENLERARARLALVIPASAFLIFVLLYASVNRVRLAVLVFTGIPLAVVGGVLALVLRGMPFSISAGIGFIAVSGIAVLDGLVMVETIAHLLREGEPLERSVREGAIQRLRPVLTTALVASLGFVPMAVSTSAGAEVQRPLATVVIGGLATSTLLSLVVVPVLYEVFERAASRRSRTLRESDSAVKGFARKAA